MKAPITVEERGNAAVAWQQGPKHKFYEDRYRLLCPPIPLVEQAARGVLFAVCDGVGSAEKGMAAAQEVCSTLIKFYEKPGATPATSESIGTLLLDASQSIHAWGMIGQTDRPIGACAGSIVWIREDLTTHIFHVGDTTVLLIRGGTAQPQTTIHQSADGHLSNYFGQAELRIETHKISLQEGDRLLLMSDGITKALHHQQIAQIVETHPTRSASLNALITAARIAGSGDDATAILIDIEK